MPFRVELKMPALSNGAIVEQWLVPTNEYVGRDRPILSLKMGDRSHVLVCNMPVVVLDRAVTPGSSITTGGLVAVVEAEGDEIPYGRPHARIE